MKPSRRTSHSFSQHSVGVLLSRNCKAGRDKLSGIMRCLYKHKDICATFLGADAPADDMSLDFDVLIGNGVFASQIRKALPKKSKLVLIEPFKRGQPFWQACVRNNAQDIATAGASLLMRRGHTNFAYVGTNLKVEIPCCDERSRAYASYLESTGHTCHVFRNPPKVSAHTEEEMHGLVDFLSRLPIPCGIMVYADSMAQTVIDACHYLHLSIPEQIAIVGVDNETEICENLHPTLTSILPDFEKSGFLAAQAAVDLLHGGSQRPMDAVYGVKAIIERESTQDLRGGGRLVSQATEYMRKNFAEGINVADVAASLNVSRRLLEMRFREILDETAHECLSRIRIDEAKRRLEKTSMSVGEIAAACGYGTYKPFRLAFIAATGNTPRRWRERTGS